MSRFPVDQYRAAILYEAFVHPGRHDPQSQAKRGGLSYETLKKLWEGKRHLHGRHIEAILRSTGDDLLASKLAGLDRCGRVVMHAPATKVTVSDVRAATAGLMSALGQLARDQEAGLADGHLDRGERAACRADLEALVQAAAGHLANLDQLDRDEEARPLPLRRSAK